jgi:hypothetical protein
MLKINHHATGPNLTKQTGSSFDNTLLVAEHVVTIELTLACKKNFFADSSDTNPDPGKLSEQ